MTILMTILITAIAAYIGKELLSVSSPKKEMQPIRIKANEKHPKNRR